MIKKDIIIGCVSHYDWGEIKYWANSIKMSGFQGRVILILYNASSDLIKKCLSEGIEVKVFHFNSSGGCFYGPRGWLSKRILTMRFLHIAVLLRNLKLDSSPIRFVIVTDVRDVIFQKNPSAWLKANIGDKKIVLQSEGLKYGHEAWSDENVKVNYGKSNWKFMKNKPIYNAGIIAGHADYIQKIFMQIYFLSLQGKITNDDLLFDKYFGTDQAAMNILIQRTLNKKLIRFTKSEEGWCCQTGTFVDPKKIDKFRPHLDEPEPYMKNGFVYTKSGKIYSLVHQYDRVPTWKQVIESHFDLNNEKKNSLLSVAKTKMKIIRTQLRIRYPGWIH